LDDAWPTVGIIANPVSARDIRRVIANASNLQTSERVNIVLRLLSTLHSLGVARVLMMPDKAGMKVQLRRQLTRAQGLSTGFPIVDFLNFEPSSTVDDSMIAARMMREAQVKAIIVLGGDGTHRIVARECGAIPIAGLSTGTNNAFPELREPTITAMAVALFACGRLSEQEALMSNKWIEVDINEGERRDIAIVDAVVAHDRVIGSRALWKTESLAAIYLSYASPEAIGLSSIGGLLHPVSRSCNHGLAIQLSDSALAAASIVKAPIAPGMIRALPIAHWNRFHPEAPEVVPIPEGIIALDGERELPFDSKDRVRIILRRHAFFSVNVSACMNLAAEKSLFQFSINPST